MKEKKIPMCLANTIMYRQTLRRENFKKTKTVADERCIPQQFVDQRWLYFWLGLVCTQDYRKYYQRILQPSRHRGSKEDRAWFGSRPLFCTVRKTFHLQLYPGGGACCGAIAHWNMFVQVIVRYTTCIVQSQSLIMRQTIDLLGLLECREKCN